MRRRLALITIVLLTAGVLLAGCSRTVRVQTGERITCTYGEVVTDTVKTIEVSAAEAGGYHVVVKTVTCDRHKHLEALYAEAQDFVVAGDLKAARAKLTDVVTIEPLFRNAQQQIDAIDHGTSPKPDTSTSKTPASSTPSSPAAPAAAPAAGQQPVGPVASLSTWVPATLPGYSATPIIADVYTLTREYLPAAGAPTYALVVVVEQYKDANSAKTAIRRDVSRSYPTSGANVSVAGRSVYFGTDGKRRAIMAWNENGVVVVIEGAAKSGSPVGLKSHLSGLVGSIVK
jgi:hypothetical protein